MENEQKAIGSIYKLTLVGEGVSLQREVSESIARRVMTLAMGGGMSTADPVLSEGQNESSPITGGASPKIFMAEKRPATDVERITCLAYYLAHYRNTPHFKTIDLTKLNTEAAQPPFSNATVTARNAAQQTYLAAAGGGKKQITTRGEALIDALPDREKAKAALEQHPLRKRRSPTNSIKKLKPS